MNDQKDLGIVIGQLRYLTEEFHEVKKDVKMLVGLRWSRYGANAVISILCSGAIAILIAIIERH